MTFARICLITVLCSMAIGCSRNEVPKATIELKQQLFDDALLKMSRKDFAGVKESCISLLQGGGLNADQASEGALMLIEACIRTGDLERADLELKNALATSLDMARAYSLEAMYYRKKGDQASADASTQKALEINPELTFPE